MKTYSTLALLFLIHLIQAQNLVYNPGFEILSPETPDSICNHLEVQQFNSWLPGWSTFESVTPDVIRLPEQVSNCPDVAVHQGRSAGGIYNFHPAIDAVMNRDYHEFIQGTLTSPLIPGNTYQVEVWVQLNNVLGGRYLQEAWPYLLQLTPRGCNNLGFLFSENASSEKEDFQQSITDFNLRPQVNFTEIIKDEGVWLHLQATFTAARPYRYFVIGNFFSDFSTQIYPDDDRERIDAHNRQPSPARNKFRRYSYLVLDDLYVGPPRAEPTLEEQLAENASFTFRNLQFDSGKATILSSSFAELDELAAYLERNPLLQLRINGHTDNIGSIAVNQELSENRAQAVVDYLATKGVAASRLEAVGRGETAPIATNDTPQGRAQNRRVVIEIIE